MSGDMSLDFFFIAIMSCGTKSAHNACKKIYCQYIIFANNDNLLNFAPVLRIIFINEFEKRMLLKRPFFKKYQTADVARICSFFICDKDIFFFDKKNFFYPKKTGVNNFTPVKSSVTGCNGFCESFLLPSLEVIKTGIGVDDIASWNMSGDMPLDFFFISEILVQNLEHLY